MEVNNALPDRIQAMKDEFLSIKPSISIDRAIATTHIYKTYQNIPTVELRAKAFARACETIPLHIGPRELIVGRPAGKPRAGVFCPEIAWRWLQRELDTVSTRAQDPYDLEAADKKVLKEEIFPYWEGKSVEEIFFAQVENIGILPLLYESGVLDAEVKASSGAGEFSPGFRDVVFKKGFNGIKKDAQKTLDGFSYLNQEDHEKIHFLRSVLTICDGVNLLARRYAEFAQGMADREKDSWRKRELEKISEMCHRVPAEPPRSFQEALQAIWMVQVTLFLEENAPSLSPGRIDQYLYPYYQADIEKGDLTPADAQELMYCFLLKFNEIPWLLNEFAAMYYAGYMAFQNVIVGGQTRDGSDATNELSYMVLDCSKNLQLYQPSLAVRIHAKSPPDFLVQIAEVIKIGIGFPAIHFDDVTIKMLLSLGVSLEDARDYCIAGCVEPSVSGVFYRWTEVCYANFPSAVEFALTNGVQVVSGKKLGIDTGDPAEFKTFQEFEYAVKAQLKNLINVAAVATHVAQEIHRDVLPKPLASSLMTPCVETGVRLMKGGAKYNSGPGLIFAGTADYADSMAAVKKVVFEDGRVSMPELCRVLADNFDGHDRVHQWLKEAPKYGNGDTYVDDFAKDIIDFTSLELQKQKTMYAHMALGTLPVSSHVPQGLSIGPLPSGRKSKTPLADGISPGQGNDVLGPTAIIKSVDTINQEASTVGVLHNMKITPDLLEGNRGIANFIALLRTHDQMGGGQVQFNCVERKTLLAAQETPDDFRSLMVRVAGYSAFFVELCREIQDEIISRTPQKRLS
jgi:choline trimethylamine-lyase